jgi:hypothetical protein
MLTTFTVTNLNDAVANGPDSAGTLRQAIFDANSSPDPDVIEFAVALSGNVNLSVIGDIDPTAGASDLFINSPVTIRGNANGITIERAATATDRRLFRVASGGDLTLESIMLTGGTSRGANVGAAQNAGSGFGGAVYNQGTLRVISSTLYGNHAIGGNAGAGGSVGAGFGGAIYNDGGTVSITNSTVSGNSVSSGTGGAGATSFAGAFYGKNGTLQIYNSTITLNEATSARDLFVGTFAPNQTANLNIYSSIIAHADKLVSTFDFVATEVQGGTVVVAGANNLIRSQNAYQSITVSNDPPLLGGLANNGGPTLTHALLNGSPAIDHGANPQSLNSDQRGSSFGRIIGSATDIGAFEVQTVAGPALPGDYSANFVVDAADYVLWRKTLGTSVSQFSGADGNGSGAIDAGDYDVWRANFGTPSGTGATTTTAAPVIKLIQLQSQRSSSDPAPLVVVSTMSAALQTGTKELRLLGTCPALPGNSERARELALLALINPDLNSGLLSPSSRLRSGTEHIHELAAGSKSDDLLALGLTQALLQMRTLFSASTCKA